MLVGLKTDAHPARSQAERAYWLLVNEIISLELPPGQLLHDKELTAKFGIGRTPVREALQRLAGEGLVVHYPHRGIMVAEINATSTRDVYEFRSLIDGEAARLAAIRATKEEASELLKLAEDMKSLADGDDVDAYVETDRAFYHLLGDACRNVYIAETIPRIFNLHLRLWFYISKMRGDWKQVGKAHSAMASKMAKSISRGDQEAAEKAVHAYVAQRQKDMRELM